LKVVLPCFRELNKSLQFKCFGYNLVGGDHLKLPTIDFSTYKYPLRFLLLGNEDTWSAFLQVIEDLTPDQLAYKHQDYSQRTIAEMVNHALDTQYGFYTQHVVLGNPIPENLYKDLPKTTEEGIKRVVEVYKKTCNLWKGLNEDVFRKEIKTEWGQVLTGELALFQSVTHTHYHLSEICFLRGLGGFPTQVMG